MFGILTFIFVVALSMFITKVGAIALTQTGMPRVKAQFQARSAFSGAGFTTSESESVVKHPLRRSIIMSLILLGNAGFVTAVSSVILGFSGQQMIEGWRSFVFLVIGLILLYLVKQSKRLDRLLEKIIIWFLGRFTRIKPMNFERIMTVMEDYEVSEVPVSENPGLAGNSLAELCLTRDGLLVLGIVCAHERYIGVPAGDYRIDPEDRLVLYGRNENIEALSKRFAKDPA